VISPAADIYSRFLRWLIERGKPLFDRRFRAVLRGYYRVKKRGKNPEMKKVNNL